MRRAIVKIYHEILFLIIKGLVMGRTTQSSYSQSHRKGTQASDYHSYNTLVETATPSPPAQGPETPKAPEPPTLSLGRSTRLRDAEIKSVH
eukprot:scaffold482_cov266-Amphora_coffeaeformis.AAC.64